MPRTAAPGPLRWSRPLVLITGILLALGLALGALTLGSDRPEQPHRPGDNAITAHLVVTAIVIVAAAVATALTRSLRWLLSPWTRLTGARIRMTFARARGSFIGVLRCAVFVLVAVLIGYLVLRMGMQGTIGLDPLATRNAWGGPSPIGAFLAHGVDAVLCVGLASLVAHLVLRRVESPVGGGEPAAPGEQTG